MTPLPTFDSPREYGTPPGKKRRWVTPVVGIAALLTGLGIGSAGGGETVTTTEPGDTVTTVRTVTAPPPAGETSKAKPPKASGLGPDDFEITVKTLKKDCFGSAGCNVIYRINPSYTGQDDLPEGDIEVTYEVTGLEDSQINTFSIDSSGKASFDEEESGSTTSASKKLKAKVLEVAVTP